MTETETNLLIELQTEELPPKSLKLLTESFGASLSDELNKIGFKHATYDCFGTPRRLGARVHHIPKQLPDAFIEKRGPALSVAFDDNGQPTKAALGWAKSNNIRIEDADVLKTEKGSWLHCKLNQPGKTLNNELSNVLSKVIKRLPIAKPMRWGNKKEEFIRPVHNVLALHGCEIVQAEAFGLSANNITSTHRFHGSPKVTINHENEYEKKLEEGFVLASYSSRMAKIENAVKSITSTLQLRADYDSTLLEEISSLVEWPVVLKASFENDFLSVPKEALIYTMKDDQKYIPLTDAEGNLSNQFLFVSNIESIDPSKVIQGNEKVVRPRLADAKFFFDTDKKSSLEDKSKHLEAILFQKDLGSIGDRSRRVGQVVKILNQYCGFDDLTLEHSLRAAKLAKADLVSNMVSEFTAIQGTMGKYYALHDKEPYPVAVAIEEQYLPKFSNDKLPSSETGVLLALADKLDLLVGLFSINVVPKGDKDPFALRRAAIGFLRILISNEIRIPIFALLNQISTVFTTTVKSNTSIDNLTVFLLERCKNLFAEEGISTDIVNSVSNSSQELCFYDMYKRAIVIKEFSQSASGNSLISINKRVKNILEKNNVLLNGDLEVNRELLVESAEKALHDKIDSSFSSDDINSYQYEDFVNKLIEFEEPLDAFFNEVMIMSEDEQLKTNRINLLAKIKYKFDYLADMSLINV